LVLLESEQMPVAGDDEIDLAKKGGGNYVIVVRIVGNDARWGRWGYDEIG